MFRVLDVNADGRPEVSTDISRVGLPPAGCVRWVDLWGHDESELELLRERFNFHHLAIEDCAHFDQRPKLVEYPECLFLVTQGFTCVDERVHDLRLHELHTFLGERYLVTVHVDPIRALDVVWNRGAAEPQLLQRGVTFAYYLIADGIVDDNFPILDKLADELETVEDAVLATPQRDDLARMFEIKHTLVAMRRVLSPQRDVIALLTKRGDPKFEDRLGPYFRDVYDHLVRINEVIDSNRDLLGNVLDAYLSAVSNRTNEIMKYLTVMSAVFLPLAFIVGFFGQNFHNLPGLRDWVQSDALMYVMLGLCAGTPLAMLLWFKRKGWL